MKQLCNGCLAFFACRHTFGMFYKDKSHGGVGCDNPMPSEWASEVVRSVLPISNANKKPTQMELI